jgi:hypothetical protein
MLQEKNKKEAEQEDREKMQFLVSNFTGEQSTESSLNYNPDHHSYFFKAIRILII